jgi:hypothetical protein
MDGWSKLEEQRYFLIEAQRERQSRHKRGLMWLMLSGAIILGAVLLVGLS